MKIHPATLRELFPGRLTPCELQRLTELYEKAPPGVGRSYAWPRLCD